MKARLVYNLLDPDSKEANISQKGSNGLTETAPTVLRALLVGVERSGDQNLWSVDDSLEELRYLALTDGIEAVASVSQKLKEPNPSHYVGKGKLEEIASLKAEMDCNLVIFDDELSPVQQRNLERFLDGQVLDRTGLILDIFAKRARTHEGRLQVELARHEYLLPRLTRQWTHLSRQFGAVGVRGGPGETQLEIDRRLIKQRICDLKAQIERVRTHRGLHRSRRAVEGLPVAALVGYTNAGKSTLLRALSGADTLVEDKLFATLDPLTRRVDLSNGHTVLVSDTVGFIQKLPPTVVAAFRATLEELHEADVLLHVVDITHKRGYEQAHTVTEILNGLGVGDKPTITALNKVDRLFAVEPENLEEAIRQAPAGSAAAMLGELVAHYPNGVAISAERGWGLDTLRARIDEVLGQRLVNITVELPYSAGRLVALFRQRASHIAERHTDNGTLLSGRLPKRFLHIFGPYAVS